ncbi:hypothetical protein DENSPDRAFT_820936 [Dentipellis sp. KUC8613]|nr:hypothetical protein DENSPDRAFT_820936 [Dentipellis sp. KUC8613]
MLWRCFFWASVASLSLVRATPVLYDGRARFDYNAPQLNASSGPYLTAVKGTEPATHYTSFLGFSTPSTPLWTAPEQSIRITIDNSSVFTPGSSTPQFGFRRTELIAQSIPSPFVAANQTAFDEQLETGITVFHFSVKADDSRRLSFGHEYQVVWIEPDDGSHVFELQLGTPFNTTPSETAHALKVRSHDLTELFIAPFTPDEWHNFAVVVDWTKLTLAVLYSTNGSPLAAVTHSIPNTSVAKGPEGQGDFHFGVLKLPLIDPKDTPAEQADVVHYGIQEGTTEGLVYSGVFVEDARRGVSLGHGAVVDLQELL